jgi:hypothetical protein
MPLSQKLWTLVRRSAKVVGVGSERLSKTLIKPLFSATKTRPSLENWTVVGSFRPLKTTFSWKPEGSVATAFAEAEGSRTIITAARAAVAVTASALSGRETKFCSFAVIRFPSGEDLLTSPRLLPHSKTGYPYSAGSRLHYWLVPPLVPKSETGLSASTWNPYRFRRV